MDTNARDDVMTLNELRRHFTNDEEIVKFLRGLPGFARINRSSISRWGAKGPAQRLPRRARVAIEVLRVESRRRSSGQGLQLRIAHHPTPLALTLVLVYAKQTADLPGARRKSLLELFGARCERVPAKNGSDSLKAIADKQADLALAHEDLLEEFHVNAGCVYLCRVANAYLPALARKKLSVPGDLGGLRFGYPDGTTFKTRIEETLARIGYPREESGEFLIPYRNANDAAEALKKGRIDCLYAWPEWLELARTKSGKTKLTEVHGSLFGRTYLGVYVNVNAAEPAAVRSFLHCLKQVTDKTSYYLERVSDTDIQETLRMTKSEITEKMKSDITFELDNFNLDVILSLWDSEAKTVSQT